MSHAIDELLHEHDAIRWALRILASINQRLLDHGAVAPVDLKAFLGFFKEFGDKCHHGKEECLLFPAVAEAAGLDSGALLGELLAEHAQGRRWMAQMAAAIEPEFRPAEFVRAAQGYEQMLELHIRKENDVLFPLAERTLPPERLQALYRAFEDHKARVIGAGRHEQLHALLRSLSQQYASL